MLNVIVNELYNMIGIVVAVVLGFIIGYERKLRSKEAGIGTHTIVCMGAAVMVVVSKYGFGGEADAARIAAQIVSGIGFLGAGIIVYRQHAIHGLTTAAGIWATAGIGMACGAELYVVAVLSTILMILVQVLYHSGLKVFQNNRFYRLRIVFTQTNDEAKNIKEIFGVQHFHKFTIERKNEETSCSALLLTDTEYPSEKLNEIMKSYPFILSIQREDDD